MEESSRRGTLCCCERLIIRTVLGVDVRCCLFSLIIASLVLFVGLCLFITSVGYRGSHDELEALHLNRNALAAVFNESRVPPTEPPVLLLILVHASASAEGRWKRDAIRNTWLSDVEQLSQNVGQSIKYRFVLGGKNLSLDAEANLTTEAEVYRDLIILENVTDSHNTLTERTLESFEYIIRHNYNFLYILKCDDDTFVNVKVIAKELKEKMTNKQYYWGEFLGATAILREGPYAEQKWSTCDTYLPYAYGGGYIISKDLIDLIAFNAPYLMIYNNEDVSLGAWLAPYNVNYCFDARFNTGGVSRGCKRQFIVMHKISTDLMYDYYDAVKKDGYICNRKNRWFGWHGHIYNWNTLPSKCCKRKRRIP